VTPVDEPTAPSRPAPLSQLSGLFLLEGGEERTSEWVRCTAGRIIDKISSLKATTIAIASPSPSFIVACTLALWKLGRAPVVLDPSLASEPWQLLDSDSLVTLVSQSSPTQPHSVQISGTGGSPIECAWPSDVSPALRFLTSGSTGEPKLVTKRGYQLLRQFEHEFPMPGLGNPRRVLSLVPPFHILGFMYGLIVPLATGGLTSFAGTTAPSYWLSQIHSWRPDMVIGVPSHYRYLADSLTEPLPPALYLSSGAPLPESVDTAFYNASGHRIVQIYGSTETGGVAFRTGVEPWRPFAGLEWRIDPGSTCLMVRSPWQETPNSWYLTDDLAAPATTGFRLLGRVDSLIKVGGKRFSTQELINAAQAHPAVEAAATVLYSRPSGETAVALFAMVAPGLDLLANELRNHMSTLLAPYKIPRTVKILGDLPLLPTGKINFEMLRGMAATAERRES